MGERRSPPETSDLLASFHMGFMKQTYNQLVAIRKGQEISQATHDRHLVLTGQVLEAIRMGTPTAPPPSGPKIMQQIKEVLSFLGALYKAWPVIRWALALNTFGWLAKQGAKLLGWL